MFTYGERARLEVLGPRPPNRRSRNGRSRDETAHACHREAEAGERLEVHMKKFLQSLYQATERIMLKIEDQAARPIVWIVAEVKSMRSTEMPPSASHGPNGDLDQELDDEPRNPLRRWRWA